MFYDYVYIATMIEVSMLLHDTITNAYNMLFLQT